MIIAMWLLVKFRFDWKAVLATMLPFLLALLGIVIVVTRAIKVAKVAKAMVTDDYDYMTGEEFEEFCADILRGNGYTNVEVTKASGDHGVDILASKDGLRYAIQCKRYSKSVGNKAIQEAYSGKDIYKADVAVVMSNMDFTSQAIDDARKLGVELWDRNKIYTLQKRGNVVIEESVTSDNDSDELICPNCGGNLVIRTAKRGARVGKMFYGCSNFPNCRYTRNL
jgi:restriction system protein